MKPKSENLRYISDFQFLGKLINSVCVCPLSFKANISTTSLKIKDAHKKLQRQHTRNKIPVTSGPGFHGKYY